MSEADAGLILFVAATALNAAGLLLDLFLFAEALPTITARVWARPILGLPIVAVQGAAMVGLALHFYARR